MKSSLDQFAYQASDKSFCGRARSCLVILAPTMALLGLLSFVSCAGGSRNGQPQLSTSLSRVSFGNVVIGTTNTQAITLTNSGNANLSISQVTISGSGFSITGVTTPQGLAAGQSSTVTVEFSPQEAGSVSGSVSLVSNAPTSPNMISLSGIGAQTASHSATLNWDPSTSTVIGYDVYRGTQSGGPYTRLNPSVIAASTYSDSSVRAGQTYFYVTTAVDSNSVESVYSNEASATIPTP